MPATNVVPAPNQVVMGVGGVPFVTRKEVDHNDDVPDVDDVDLECCWRSAYHSADCSNREAAEEITAPMWRLSGQYPLTQNPRVRRRNRSGVRV